MKKFFKLILLIGIICLVQQISYAQKASYQIKTYFNFSHFSKETTNTNNQSGKIHIVEEGSTDFGLISKTKIDKAIITAVLPTL